MPALRKLLLCVCILPLFWLTASAQTSATNAPGGDENALGAPPAPSQLLSSGGNPAQQSRIEAESNPAAAAAAATVNSGTAAAEDAAARAAAIADAPTAATQLHATADAETTAAASSTTATERIDESEAEADSEDKSMQSDPLMIFITFAIAAYLFHLWLQDYRASRAGKPSPSAFPGATAASTKAVGIAIVGALVLLAAETGGELALGISGEQSTMTVLMLLSITAAAFFEELIFRGYLVISNKGRALLIGSIFGFSVLFAIAHPFLWDITTPEGIPGWQIWNADWRFHFDSTKGWFSTLFVLVNSLWFYAVRFAPFNPGRSLIPCIAAHLAMNWGVFLIKLGQGHVSGLL